MNFSFYLFGTPNRYDQFPLDKKNTLLFKNFAQNTQNGSQLIIYRDGQLFYYAYIYEFQVNNRSQYFGVCLIFNGVYCSDTKQIFDLFIYTISSEVLSKGEILLRNSNGNIVFAVNKFKNKQIEIDRLRMIFQKYVNRFNRYFIVLNNSFIGMDEVKCMSIKDGNEAISSAIHKYKQIILTESTVLKPVKRIKRNHRIIFFVTGLSLSMLIAIVILYNDISINESTTSVMTVDNVEISLLNGITYLYSGETKDSLPDGKGQAIYPDKSIYEGSFEKGLRHGKGTRTFSDGHIYYGNYVEDKAEGEGEMLYPNGWYYVGEWKDDLKHGIGVLYDDTGMELFHGEWQNDREVKIINK
jgi:hypothetical protein